MKNSLYENYFIVFFHFKGKTKEKKSNKRNYFYNVTNKKMSP